MIIVLLWPFFIIGYSFTKSKDAYAKNQEDVSRDLYEALIQFFTIFPEYCKVPFYIVGTSYAGKLQYCYQIHSGHSFSSGLTEDV